MTVSMSFISLWLIGHFPFGLACGWLPHQVGRRGGSAFLLFTPLLSTLHLHFHVLATETVDGYRAFVFGECLPGLQVGSLRTISVLFSACPHLPHTHSPLHKGGAQWRVEGWMNEPVAWIDIWHCWTWIGSKENWVVLRYSELFLSSEEGPKGRKAP